MKQVIVYDHRRGWVCCQFGQHQHTFISHSVFMKDDWLKVNAISFSTDFVSTTEFLQQFLSLINCHHLISAKLISNGKHRAFFNAIVSVFSLNWWSWSVRGIIKLKLTYLSSFPIFFSTKEDLYSQMLLRPFLADLIWVFYLYFSLNWKYLALHSQREQTF